MSRFDLVIFGATGFTGKHVVRELIRIAPKYPGLTWAVAGRSRGKMETLLQHFTKRTGVELSNIKIIIADVSDAESLKSMCSQAKVLVNCCGPFIKYGEPVVSAAIESKTHHVDVSAEIKFTELLHQKFDSSAREAGVCVVYACGLCSLPADVGVLYLQREFEGVLNSVESYLITYFPPKMLYETWKNGIVRYSTWESLINGMASISIKQLQQNSLPPLEHELKSRCLIHRNLNKWCIPFPGADAAVISRTQRHLLSTTDNRPVQYKPYITFPSIFTAIGAIIAGVLLFALSKMSWTRKLLLNYPRLCTFGVVTYGDTEEGVMDDAYFQYEMMGNGWSTGADRSGAPDKNMVARINVSGVDPAYVGSAIVLIYSAITLLKEKDRIPECGVMTPGVAFKNTNIIEHLKADSVKFDIVK
ncbi:unnamed protein product [Danaus chrysippus]|uniref:(African queen) hypothetical protein n=1 Tax=Danaus chrysippus TaxID=151541 RepID=A0A8J2RER6_9NEOP|nr:unnamed protein product [Danaus chrysippus]